MSGKAPTDTTPETDAAPPWARALLDRVAELEGELRQARSAAPSFVPMKAATQTGARVDNRGLGQDVPGLAKDGTRQMLTTTRGILLNEMTLRQYPRRFGPGSPVRIDPESAREGFPEGRTWGPILAQHGSAGYGEVVGVKGLREGTGEWQYYVEVPGITGAQPDGFGDHELLPA